MQEEIHISPVEVLWNRHNLTPGTLELVKAVATAYRCEFQTEEQYAVFYGMLGAIFHAGEISGKRAERNRPKYDEELRAYYAAQQGGIPQ
mgnify:CR=1 FL=1